jgi:curved DNA-binding protein CbpA
LTRSKKKEMALIVERLYEAYRLLGVSADSSLAEITKAYRQLAKKYHPDSNPTNQSYAHEMMMKLNEAYTLIKDTYGYELRHEVSAKVEDTEDRTIWAWIKRYEREKEEERLREQRELERRRRESEALKKFWEKVVHQRQQEATDQKTFETVKKYAHTLVSYFYKKNYHNVLAVRRQYLQDDFDEYIEKFKGSMKKIRVLAGTSTSKLYRKKITTIYNFLRSFILDAVRESTPGLERRASAFDSYGTAARDLQKFLGSYFSVISLTHKELKNQFTHTLGSFEKFLNSYPDSPLIDQVKGKIEILENFFRAYLKE